MDKTDQMADRSGNNFLQTFTVSIK